MKYILALVILVVLSYVCVTGLLVVACSVAGYKYGYDVGQPLE